MHVIRRRAWIALGGNLCLVVILGACGILPGSTVDKKRDPVVVDSSVVQSLHRQIKEREKRIVELEAQLDALKLIDQDMEKRRQSGRPTATSTPIEWLSSVCCAPSTCPSMTGLSLLQNGIELLLRVSWRDCAMVCTD